MFFTHKDEEIVSSNVKALELHIVIDRWLRHLFKNLKYQANQLSALLSNMSLFDKMLTDYSEGSGSAMVEAQKSADNWSGSLNKLSNTWTSIVNNFVNSDDMISAINTANSALETLDKLTKNIDITSLSTLGTILGGVLGAKNAGRAKSYPLMNMPAVA